MISFCWCHRRERALLDLGGRPHVSGDTELERVKAADTSFLDAVVQGVFTVPGDGDIDFDVVVKALLEHDYRGWLVVEAEQDPALADPLTCARAGRRHLASLSAWG